MKWMYIDRGTNKYTTHKTLNGMTIFRGNSDIYIEAWNTEDNMRFEVAYLPMEYKDKETHDLIFQTRVKKLGCVPCKLAYLVMPGEEFDTEAKTYKVKVHEDDVY